MKALIPLLIAAAVQQPQQFDLVCTGTVQGYPQNHPTSRRYHVDLTSQKWCAGEAGECALRSIVEIDPDVIWFERKQPRFPGDDKITDYVDRASGKWILIMGPMDAEGSCEPAPFSGFSTAATKF